MVSQVQDKLFQENQDKTKKAHFLQEIDHFPEKSMLSCHGFPSPRQAFSGAAGQDKVGTFLQQIDNFPEKSMLSCHGFPSPRQSFSG